MANLTETPTYEAGIYQLELSDPVIGGPGGISNLQGQQLANRTAYLKQHVDSLESASLAFATTAQLNAAIEALDYKANVRLATTTGIALTGVQTIDGVLGAVGDRILVKNQLTASQNGIYVMSATAWSRAADASITAEVTSQLTVAVSEGTLYANTRWRLATPDPIVLDTTNLTFQDVTSGYAPLNSPALIGTPSTPTQPSGTANTWIASTAFAENLKNGIASIDVAGGANVAVTSVQAGAGLLVLTGTITANIDLILPTKNGQWVVANRASGSFNITVKYATGTGVVLPQNAAVIVYGDSTNVNSASTTASQLAFAAFPFTPTAGTTSLTIPGGYTPGAVQIEKNGAWLHPSEFTATNGSTITIAATIGGDVLTVYAFRSFSVANAVLKAGDTMGGDLFGVTAPQFASDTKMATTAFVQRALGGVRGHMQINTTTTLTAATHAGYFIQCTAAGAITLTLPLASACPSGTAIWIENTSSTAAAVVQRQGSDSLVNGGTSGTSVSLGLGDSMLAVSSGTAWYIISGSIHLAAAGVFGSSLVANGYQKMPSGMIIQWGQQSVAASATTTFSFPLTFPTAALHISCSFIVPASSSANAGIVSASQYQLQSNFSGGSQTVRWIAIGY